MTAAKKREEKEDGVTNEKVEALEKDSKQADNDARKKDLAKRKEVARTKKVDMTKKKGTQNRYGKEEDGD